MAGTAAVVFIALYFVKAGYGIMRNGHWGPQVPNRLGWILMEAPVFIAMCLLWWFSPRRWDGMCLVLFGLFQLHYFNRSFIYPFLLKGKSLMPLSIIAMGVVFNVLNAIMQGGWIFYFAPADRYTWSWLATPQFIAGTVIFFTGMVINMHSDYIIRHLRKPGDTGHYLPRGGMFRYVSSANYFGEIVEWTGFAILTWSLAGAVFALWTFANLVPRAHAIYRRYEALFGEEFVRERRKRVIPFIY
ncbi:MAG: DUF1295 domain-containing protein [Coprobacter sp.]|nr:DUF1295 domain-containing protein [Coprobacter sp.]